ncbi:hypothetical protein KDL44_04175 [bacterium]|nr:hypothetical protein [bacterium]
MPNSKDIRGMLSGAGMDSDNPMVLLLNRQHGRSAERFHGWLARPTFMFLAVVLMLLSCGIILRQVWALSQLPQGTVHPLFVTAARSTVSGAVLWYTGLLFLMLAISRMLSGFNQGLMLLGTQRARGTGVRLDELLRSSPISSAGVLNGLLAFHLSRVTRVLWIPAVLLGLLCISMISTAHAERDSTPGPLEFLFAISIPLLAAGTGMLISASVILLGVFLGRHIRWSLLSHLLLYILAAGVMWLVLITSRIPPAALSMKIHGHTFSSPWQVLIPAFLLLAILMFVVFRRLAFIAVANRHLSPHHPAEEHVLHDPLQGALGRITPATARFVTCLMVLFPLVLAAAVFIYSGSRKYAIVATGDDLYDWYQKYIAELAVNEISNRCRGGWGSIVLSLNSRQHGDSMLRYDPAQFSAAHDRFAGDPRWYLLKIQLINEQFDWQQPDKPVDSEYGSLPVPELQQRILEQGNSAIPDSLALEFNLLKISWMGNNKRQYELQQEETPGVESEHLLAGLQAEKDEIEAGLMDLALGARQAFPLYWLALMTSNSDSERKSELIAMGNELPCTTVCEYFLPGFINELARHPEVADQSILAIMHSEGSWLTYYLQNLRGSSANLEEYVSDCIAGGKPESVNGVMTMLTRICLADDSDLDNLAVLSNCATVYVRNAAGSFSDSPDNLTDLSVLDNRLNVVLGNAGYSLRGPGSPGGKLTYHGANSGSSPMIHYLPFHVNRKLEDGLRLAEAYLSLGKSNSLAILEIASGSRFHETINKSNWKHDHVVELSDLLNFDFAEMDWQVPESNQAHQH